MEERSNIWVASSDGDLARVKQLIEKEGMDVNAQDVCLYPIYSLI